MIQGAQVPFTQKVRQYHPLNLFVILLFNNLLEAAYENGFNLSTARHS